MKKFILAIAAASMMATPVLAAPNHGPQHAQTGYQQTSYSQPGKKQSGPVARAPAKQTKAHQWKRGDRFDRARATNYRVISNPRAHKLQNAPNGYRWVQSGRDALLVRLSNNVITSVVVGAIR